MAYRRSYRSSRSRGGVRRRRTGWVRNLFGPAATGNVPPIGAVDLLPMTVSPTDLESGSVDAGSIVGSTVMRILGSFSWQFSGSVGFTPMSGIVGITVTPRSLNPDPAQGSNAWSWLYWKFLTPAIPSVGGVISASSVDSYLGVDVDVKSRRIIGQPGETLKFCWNMSSADANNMDWKVATSVLLRYA